MAPRSMFRRIGRVPLCVRGGLAIVSLPHTLSTPMADPSNYVHAGNAAARQRTVERDAPLLAPHLRPGMRLVDFDCGAGSPICGFARLIAPGEVLGIDTSADAIDHARALAGRVGLTN